MLSSGMKQLAAEGRRQLYQLDTETAERGKVRKKDRPRCGARTRSGEPCQAPAVLHGARCRLHGGAVVFPLRKVWLKKRQAEREELRRLVEVSQGLAAGARSDRRAWRLLLRLQARGKLPEGLDLAALSPDLAQK